MTLGTRGTVLALGTAQTLAWASSFYLPAVLAAPMARDLGLATSSVFGAFSLALAVAGLVAPAAGRIIDRTGGRGPLMLGNGLFALGLVALGAARGPWTSSGAWLLIGVAMGGGLYDAAFAALVRLYGSASRDPITGITLLAGFASTVGWPLTAWMNEAWGWRGACFGWAALHLLLGLPLHLLLPRAAARAPAQVPAPGPAAAAPAAAAPSGWLTLVLLAFVFAATRFVATAMGAHLPGLLMAVGGSLAAAVAAGTLVGPAQVGGRLLEFGLLRRVHPLLSARLATLGHPLGALALLAFGMPAAVPFVLLHGAGNGILTIAKGTLPLAVFGPQGYGMRQGWLSMPSLVLQALAPWLFGLVLMRSVNAALLLSASLCVAAFVALLALRMPARSPAV
ncbi:MAG: MFS transporter [Burkholderiales bacterium]|nr:MFS transporter [Burkholderiales bacterium]